MRVEGWAPQQEQVPGREQAWARLPQEGQELVWVLPRAPQRVPEQEQVRQLVQARASQLARQLVRQLVQAPQQATPPQNLSSCLPSSP